MSEMDLKVRSLRAMRYSAFVCCFFTWGWGFLALGSIAGLPSALIFLLPIIIVLPILILSIRFARSFRGIQGPALFMNRGQVWLYIAIVVLTYASFAVVGIIAAAFKHPLLTIPAGAIIIGLHFLALDVIFKDKRYYLTTAIFCLAGIVPALTLPTTATLGIYHVILWQAVTGVICCLWLWSVGLRLTSRGTRMLHEVQAISA